MKILSKKEFNEKKREYVVQERFFESWRPNGVGIDDKLPGWVPAWRAKKIKLLWSGFLGLYRMEVSMKALSFKKAKLVDVKTMEVVLERDISVGDLADDGLLSSIKGSRKIKKGSRVQVALIGLMYRGLLFKVRSKKGKSEYFFINDKSSVEYAMKKHFSPITQAWHICSIIPASMKQELMALKIKVYKENSKGRKEYTKVIEKLAA